MYGRLPTILYGRSGPVIRDKSTVRASSLTIVTASSAENRSAIEWASISSISTAIRRSAPSASRPVRAPRPGPISTTVSVADSSRAATILRAVPRWLRKFWPSERLGRTVVFGLDGDRIGCRAVSPISRGCVLRPCTPCSISSQDLTFGAGSSQVDPRHPRGPAYRCFLPDLTGFTGSRRVGPGSQHRRPGTVALGGGPPRGIQPRWSGLRVEGTASSPPSTAKAMVGNRSPERNIHVAPRVGAGVEKPRAPAGAWTGVEPCGRAVTCPP